MFSLAVLHQNCKFIATDASYKIIASKLFPDELGHLSEQMQRMMVGGSMKERDQITVDKMVQEGDMAAEKADVTMDLMVAAHQSFLYNLTLTKGNFDAEERSAYFDRLFEYLLAAART